MNFVLSDDLHHVFTHRTFFARRRESKHGSCQQRLAGQHLLVLLRLFFDFWTLIINLAADFVCDLVLKKKQEQKSGATATQEKNGSNNDFNEEGIYRNGINMHPFSISAPSAHHHPSDTYSASEDMSSSGLIPSHDFVNSTYDGVQVDIEHGRNYDEEKSMMNDSQSKLEILNTS